LHSVAWSFRTTAPPSLRLCSVSKLFSTADRLHTLINSTEPSCKISQLADLQDTKRSDIDVWETCFANVFRTYSVALNIINIPPVFTHLKHLLFKQENKIIQFIFHKSVFIIKFQFALHVSALLLRMRNVSDKRFRENQNTF